jgi:uncharacterized protein (TIGR02996 family)
MTTPTDERFFRDALADDVADSAARLLLAEWLEERGDRRAAGFRWMGRHHKYPYFLPASRKWSCTSLRNADPVHNHLPPRLYKALGQEVDSDWKKYALELDAEEDLARTIAAMTRPPA